MLLLLCFFSFSSAYTSEENSPLLNKENTLNLLLMTTKKKYDDCNQEYYNDKQIHFYDPNEKKVESFELNNWMQHLFTSLDLCIKISPNKPLYSITLIPIIEPFFKPRNPTIPDQLKQLFTSIDCLRLDQERIERILYHFKLMLYRIQKKNNIPMVNNSYTNFLQATEKCVLDEYHTSFGVIKKFIIGANTVTTICFVTPGVTLMSLYPSPIIPMVFFSPAVIIYIGSSYVFFNKYLAYKNCFETFKNINNELSESNDHV